MNENEYVLLGQIVGGVLVLGGAWLTARNGTRAANRKTAAEADAAKRVNDNAAGELALEITREIRGELKEVKVELAETNRKATVAERRVNHLVDDRRRVQEWWERRHYPWDLGMQEIATKHDPAAVAALPPLEPLPPWREDD